MSRGQLALWCGVVVVVGPMLNFAHDWQQDVPVYDHGPVAAVIIAFALTAILGLFYLPALALTLKQRRPRLSRTRLLIGAVFAASVWVTHLLRWLLATNADRSDVWVLAYPAGSLLAWLAVRHLDQAASTGVA